MRILITGGDGYLGWPTAIHLSANGHEVYVVDNYLKRRVAKEVGIDSLTPWAELPSRTVAWQEVSGKRIEAIIGDVCDYPFFSGLVERIRPDAIVHYGEQPSAPYSMIGRDQAALTLTNNLVSTLNVAHAVREHVPNCHIVKLGTMGEYGTPEIDIEEGWIHIHHKGRSDKFLFPRQAGSLYHTTKIQDTDLLWFYVRTWGLKVTDLMQGPVYGVFTDESEAHEELRPTFFYDEVFGTVVNRFIVQAVVGHPLTVYGLGGQTRGYIDIRDTVRCIRLAAENPPERSVMQIFNQISETLTVNQIARLVKKVGQKLGFRISIEHIENPRIEKEEHHYNPTYTRLLELGLEPHYMGDESLLRMFDAVGKLKDKIDTAQIIKGIKW